MRLSNKSIREIQEYNDRIIQEMGYNIYSEVNKRLDIFLNSIFQIIQGDRCYIDDIKYLHSNLKETQGGFIDILYNFIEVIEHKGIRESIYDYRINIIDSKFSDKDDNIVVSYSISKETIDIDKLKIHQMNQVLYKYCNCYKLTKDDLDFDFSVYIPMIYLDADVNKFKKAIIDIIDSYSNLRNVLCENNEDYE